MPSAVDTPSPSHRRGAWSAAAAVAGVLFAVAAAAGMHLASAAACAALASAVVWLCLDRRAARAAGDAALHVAVRAARTEAQRDAEARLLSLQMSYERSRSVLEALREGVLVVDGGGEIVSANPAARRAMKSPTLDPAGRLLWEALTPELATRARDAFDALRTGTHAAGELPQIRYSAIPCRDSVYDLTAVEAMSSRTGQDFGSVFLLVDSTRTHELQRLKDRFLSSVSHELRTPLTNICAYAEILRTMSSDESAEWPEFVRVIHEEGLQLSHLVDGMFDFLQLESGEAQFTLESLDGAAVAHAVATTFGSVAEARNIQLEVNVTSAAPVLHADRRRFEQIVRNLVDNAVKFTPDGGRVVVGISGREGGFELRVEDSRPGVPPGDRRAVFEKFHQLHDHLTQKPSGTGLGLATSRAIVARFGGLVWCEDSHLGGAGFVVLLPGVGQPKLAAIGAGTGAGGGF